MRNRGYIVRSAEDECDVPTGTGEHSVLPTVHATLRRLAEQGLVVKVGRARWQAPAPATEAHSKEKP